MTKSRTIIFDALSGLHKPCSAGDMAGKIAGICDQATVYRSLQWLEQTGLAESFVLHCAEHGTERYYVKAETPHRHWFHCESCHCFLDLGPCDIGETEARLERDFGIGIKRHTLYFSGLCVDCIEKPGKPDSLDPIPGYGG